MQANVYTVIMYLMSSNDADDPCRKTYVIMHGMGANFGEGLCRQTCVL